MVLGGPEETGQLLKHKFDYIFFTGKDSPIQHPGEGRQQITQWESNVGLAISQGRG